MQNHLRRTAQIGRDPNDASLAHEGLLMLRDNRPVELSFYIREQVKIAMERTKAFYVEHGIWPWDAESEAYVVFRPTAPGPSDFS
jgi:hypothetical protein